MLYPFSYFQGNSVPTGPHLTIIYPSGGAPNMTLADWNILLNGNYTSKTYDSTTVKLYGGSNVELAANAFNGNSLIRIADNGTVIAALTSCFEGSDIRTVYLPNCVIIGNTCFKNTFSLLEVSAQSCTTLGDSVGENGVFNGLIGQTVSVTVAASLGTANGGNPDGDLVKLAADNTVTITYV